MTKENLDKQLAGQSLTPYMPPKTQRMKSILHSEADLEVMIVQEGCTKDKISMGTGVTIGNKGLEVNWDPQVEDLELYQGFPAEDKREMFQL